MSNRRIMRALAMAGLCLWSVPELRLPAIAQAPVHIRVVDYPRPVAAAVQQIVKHFGWVVTYKESVGRWSPTRHRSRRVSRWALKKRMDLR